MANRHAILFSVGLIEIIEIPFSCFVWLFLVVLGRPFPCQSKTFVGFVGSGYRWLRSLGEIEIWTDEMISHLVIRELGGRVVKKSKNFVQGRTANIPMPTEEERAEMREMDRKLDAIAAKLRLRSDTC